MTTSLPDAARRYIDVPFRHRGRDRRGLDCAGLIVAAFRDLGVLLPDFRKYGKEPHNDGLVAHATLALGEPIATTPVDGTDLLPGDVIVMRFEIHPHHMAVVGRHPLGHLSIIHADGDASPAPGRKKPGRVLEQGLSADMIQRITHVFRRPV